MRCVTTRDKEDWKTDKVTIKAEHRCRWATDHHESDGQCAQKGTEAYGYQFCSNHGKKWWTTSGGPYNMVIGAVSFYTQWRNNPDRTENVAKEEGWSTHGWLRDEDGNIVTRPLYREGNQWYDLWMAQWEAEKKVLGVLVPLRGDNFNSTGTDDDGQTTWQTFQDWWDDIWSTRVSSYLDNSEQKPWEKIFNAWDHNLNDVFYNLFDSGDRRGYYNEELFTLSDAGDDSFFIATVGIENGLVDEKAVESYQRSRIGNMGRGSTNPEGFRLDYEPFYRGDEETPGSPPLSKRELRKFEEWKTSVMEKAREQMVEEYSWKGSRMEHLAVPVAEALNDIRMHMNNLCVEIEDLTQDVWKDLQAVNNDEWAPDEELLKEKEWTHWFSDWLADYRVEPPEAPPRKKRQSKKSVVAALKDIDVGELDEDGMANVIRALQAGEVPK